MIFFATIEYAEGNEQLKAQHPAHRAYLRTLLEDGRLRAAGPFAGDTGAVGVLDAESADDVEMMVEADPYVATGVVTGWTVRQMAYWSAQAAKGVR